MGFGQRGRYWPARSRAEIPVTFTVDAYPHDIFRGKVAQIRLNATMTQNVVTYTVVVATDNADLKLIPYLTANLQFEIEERENILQVSQAALRWRPRPALVVPDLRDRGASSSTGAKKDDTLRGLGQASGEPPAASATQTQGDRGRLWVKDGNSVRPIEVQLGISDRSQTEISGDAVQEGMEVVVGEIRPEEEAETTNPFAPKLFQGRPRSQP